MGEFDCGFHDEVDGDEQDIRASRDIVSHPDGVGGSHGYHIATISKGVLGEISKIQEELDELVDAEKQGILIMQLVELSDLVGAIKAYLRKNFPGFTLDELDDMSCVTERAFKNGHRK